MSEAPDIAAKGHPRHILDLTTIAGHQAQSTFGTALSDTPRLSTHHQPQRGRADEIHYVLSVGDHRLPVEINHQRNVDFNCDTRALRDFIAEPANRATFGIGITRPTPTTRKTPTS